MAVTTTKPETVIINGKKYKLAELSNNPGNVEDTQGYAGTVGSYANQRDIKHLTPSQLEAIIRDPKKNISKSFINAEGKKDYKMNAFAIFDHPVMGLRAMAVDINSKIKQGLTVEELVKKYAPKKDNVNQQQYIDAVKNEVSEATGKPIDVIDKKIYKDDPTNFIVIKAIMKAKLKFENGGLAFNIDGKYVPADEYYMPYVDAAYTLSKNTTYGKHKRFKGSGGLEEGLHATGDIGRTHIDYKYKIKDNINNNIDKANVKDMTSLDFFSTGIDSSHEQSITREMILNSSASNEYYGNMFLEKIPGEEDLFNTEIGIGVENKKDGFHVQGQTIFDESGETIKDVDYNLQYKSKKFDINIGKKGDKDRQSIKYEDDGFSAEIRKDDDKTSIGIGYRGKFK